MGDVAKLQLPDRQLDLPDRRGHGGGTGVRYLRAAGQTGYITLDEGYVNTGATTSAITFLDGEQGMLRYRGYPIEVLAEQCDFVEVSYLLIYGELPTARAAGRVPPSLSRGTRCCTRTCGRSTTAFRATPTRWPSSASVVGRAFDVLPGLAQPARSAAGGDLDPPADGQAADDRRLQLQEVDRPAVHLSAERAGDTARTSCR